MSIRLPRFLRDIPITTEKGLPTLQFHQWWETVLKQIEASINSITAALEAADIAIAAAEAAQSAADSVTSTAKLNTSGMTGLTITATDAGTDATVVVSNHTRVYGDGTSVSVTGASITGLSYETTYVIYYLDASFAGGAVSYLTSTDLTSVSQTGSTHVVGRVTTPAAGQPDENGAGPLPPGLNFEIVP